MKQTTSLSRKTPLKAKTSLHASDTPTKRPKSELTKLRLKATEMFSWMVRLRDSEPEALAMIGTCITCTKKGVVAWLDEKGKLRFTRGWDAGHYISRGNKFLFFNEQNVNLQCSMNCNNMKSGNIEKYKAALDDKYGGGTRAELDALAGANPTYRLKKADYERVIEDCTEQLAFYKSMLQ